jgi:prepilin-type N-terminal cleavage/methylation domain-containing protein
MRQARGFTIVELLIVMTLIALIAAVAIPCLLRAQQAARQANACALMKSMVNHEAVWRSQDLDRNGLADFWVRDVRGFYAISGGAGQPIGLIPLPIAQADRSPAFAYPAPANATVPDKGYFLQAMASDQTGAPYVDPMLPEVTAAPALGACTNRSRFGFTAFPAVYGRDGVCAYVVSEDGVIWEKDSGGAALVLDRAQVDVSTQWHLAGN